MGRFWTKLLDQIEDNVSWLPRSNDHFAIWEHFVNSIWVPEASNRPQKGLNIELNGNFSQPNSLLGSFLTNNNGFLTRWKITWADRHIPTIVFVYGNTLNRPQKRPNMMLYHSKFLNHIASILSERGLRCGAVYYPLYNKLYVTFWSSQNNLATGMRNPELGLYPFKLDW